jgi:hypothetical protein
MIDLISLIDRVVSLLDRVRNRRREEFHDFVEPVMADLTEVHRDHSKVLRDLNAMLERQESVQDVANLASQRRLDSLSVRQRVRAMIKGLEEAHHTEGSFAEIQEFVSAVISYFAHRAEGHTGGGASLLAPLVIAIDQASKAPGAYEALNHAVNDAIVSSEEGWAVVLKSYARCRIACLGPT